MAENESLSPNELNHINTLAASFLITGSQALFLYQLAGKDRARVEAILTAAKAAGEEAYTGARLRLIDTALLTDHELNRIGEMCARGEFDKSPEVYVRRLLAEVQRLRRIEAIYKTWVKTYKKALGQIDEEE